MYKILTLIHLNYKINKIMFKNIQNHILTDCLAKGVKILELHEIHLNYKFKKITFKNIQIHGLSDCLAKRVKILDGMKCSPLFAPIPLDIWKLVQEFCSRQTQDLYSRKYLLNFIFFTWITLYNFFPSSYFSLYRIRVFIKHRRS